MAEWKKAARGARPQTWNKSLLFADLEGMMGINRHTYWYHFVPIDLELSCIDYGGSKRFPRFLFCCDLAAYCLASDSLKLSGGFGFAPEHGFQEQSGGIRPPEP
jgi:hypothetical protein